MVRIGELAVSREPGEVLSSIGLGSCIGLALIARARSIVGLAHVMLPESQGRTTQPGKFADLAVKALIAKLLDIGARRSDLEAVLVGGAQMFSFSGTGLDIGARNERATLDQLALANIKVIARETAGNKGRTIRVHVDGGLVICRQAGGIESVLAGERA